MWKTELFIRFGRIKDIRHKENMMKPQKFLMTLFMLALIISSCTGESVDNQAGENIGMANPASVHCEEQGGTLKMHDSADGTQGVCIFPDGSECDEIEKNAVQAIHSIQPRKIPFQWTLLLFTVM